MKVCNDIKRRIDEADQPAQPGLEITQHTALCAGCREFADQRTALRNLVAAGARVNAPVNFDALLNARLAELKARKSFAWFSSSIYVRFGAATAAIVVAICAAQYSNLFTPEQPLVASIAPAPQWEQRSFVSSSQAVVPPPVLAPHDDLHSTTQPPSPMPVKYPNAGRNLRRYAPVSAPTVASSAVTLDDGSVIIFRGPNGEREIPMQTVYFGAQSSLLYGNAGHQPPPARLVGF
jgi:hypothetical protein